MPKSDTTDYLAAAIQKAERRKKAGRDPFIADWQATLEMMLAVGRDKLAERPGQLLPSQMNSDDEWEFFHEVREKIDLPPDTFAVFFSPDFFRSSFLAEPPDLDDNPPDQGAFQVIVSDNQNHNVIMQIILPKNRTAGVDVYEDGHHFADYTYNTTAECIAEVSDIAWMFFRPKKAWRIEQIIQYTENWLDKGVDAFSMKGIPVHPEFCYLHQPHLIEASPLQAASRAIVACFSKEFSHLESFVDITNEINRETESDAPIISAKGIREDVPAECQVLAGQLSVQVDMYLDKLELSDAATSSIRNLDGYAPMLDETISKIYQKITGRTLPKSIVIP